MSRSRWYQEESGSERLPLRCVECGREQVGDERGWRSYLTVDVDEPVGTSVKMIDRTYGHLAHDSEDAIRARLDARGDVDRKEQHGT